MACSAAALEAKVKELHAEDAVTFYGSVPATDIPKFTALADALIVCLSDSPDLGLTVPAKVASYMAGQGKPVLASMDGAGNAAVAAAGGLSSPACDAAALADNLLALTRMDAAQRARHGPERQRILSCALPPQRAAAQTGTFYFGRPRLMPNRPFP